ncbi:hypothetical protein TetV_455 [Tetraselmis virus 1]|uniref:Chromo domain-containing protein n=1 Tax=Tetraselmis virus 1 TaxID=2060617 RepID=A0A2P0VNR0_9VIRU|nr:hypothetical protein QJ968_gp599 [Tetraselmis virus 1]AUF82537.1 hypothetical protein TetV_455 [Tetraselmis virus 1]
MPRSESYNSPLKSMSPNKRAINSWLAMELAKYQDSVACVLDDIKLESARAMKASCENSQIFVMNFEDEITSTANDYGFIGMPGYTTYTLKKMLHSFCMKKSLSILYLDYCGAPVDKPSFKPSDDLTLGAHLLKSGGILAVTFSCRIKGGVNSNVRALFRRSLYKKGSPFRVETIFRHQYKDQGSQTMTTFVFQVFHDNDTPCRENAQEIDFLKILADIKGSHLVETDESEEYYVDTIEDITIDDGHIQLRVLWSTGEMSWEPLGTVETGIQGTTAFDLFLKTPAWLRFVDNTPYDFVKEWPTQV